MTPLSTNYKATTARLYRAGYRLTVDAEPFRTWARMAWSDLTLGEMALLTGLNTSTLRLAMWGKNPTMRVRTAGAIAALHVMHKRADAEVTK